MDMSVPDTICLMVRETGSSWIIPMRVLLEISTEMPDRKAPEDLVAEQGDMVHTRHNAEHTRLQEISDNRAVTLK